MRKAHSWDFIFMQSLLKIFSAICFRICRWSLAVDYILCTIQRYCSSNLCRWIANIFVSHSWIITIECIFMPTTWRIPTSVVIIPCQISLFVIFIYLCINLHIVYPYRVFKAITTFIPIDCDSWWIYIVGSQTEHTHSFGIKKSIFVRSDTCFSSFAARR